MRKDQSLSLHLALRQLEQSLPQGSWFQYSVEGKNLHLDLLSLPIQGQGQGTQFLAKVLALADREGCVTTLHADPTDEPDDPDTFALVKWYVRFGFRICGIGQNGWIEMAREPLQFHEEGEILQAYREASGRDITREELRENIERYASVFSP